jgi:putative membrane protein
VAPKPLAEVDALVHALTRPHKNLLWLYVIRALFTLPLAPLVFLPLYFHYETLRFRFDVDGVHASWGILLRREVSLNYARIQDIHLRRGPLERWLGLGSVQIQTASGGGAADLVIEGITQFNEVRDFLYAKMRGAHADKKPAALATGNAVMVGDQAVQLLLEIKQELAAVREGLAKRA